MAAEYGKRAEGIDLTTLWTVCIMSGVALGTFLISIHWIEISSSMIAVLAPGEDSNFHFLTETST